MEYHLKTKYREFRLTVTEHPERVQVDLWASKYGNFLDLEEFNNWVFSILLPYESDSRPTVMYNQHSGEVASIYPGFAIVRKTDS